MSESADERPAPDPETPEEEPVAETEDTNTMFVRGYLVHLHYFLGPWWRHRRYRDPDYDRVNWTHEWAGDWPDWFRRLARATGAAIVALLALFVVFLVAAVVARAAKDFYDSMFGGSNHSKPTPAVITTAPTTSFGRAVTIADFTRLRGVDVSKTLPGTFQKLSNGNYSVAVTRYGSQLVNMTLKPGRVLLLRNARYKATTITFVYNHDVMFTTPRYVGSTAVRVNDPFAPHSNGNVTRRLIVKLNRMTTSRLVQYGLRTVVIRTPKLK